MPVKILCTADVHIGRRPSRLPSRVDTAPLSCARLWGAIVERAIAERVDLVAVAGDLVDQENRFYEAVGPIEAGVRALVSRGIRTVAVGGNHDHDILPWIAERFSPGEFDLLGRSGRWERLTIAAGGDPVLHIDGWSFPSASHLDDPLQGYPGDPGGGVPVLGLLHGDLEQPGSRHAPVTLPALRATPVSFWLLGHVHRHACYEAPGAASVLYPGSPLAMDPGEPGVHGPWLLEIDAGGRFTARHLPLSPVRYEVLEVDVGEAVEIGEVDRRIVDAVSAELRRLADEAGPLRYLNLRVRLIGRTPLHRTLQGRSADFASELEVTQGPISALVERVEVATRPQRDLETLARGSDAPALLARLVLGLERGASAPEETRLLHAALTRAGEVRTARPYLPLEDSREAITANRVGEIAGEQALLLLDALLAEQEAP